MNDRDRAAHKRFGGHMTDDDAMGSSRESSVGHERDFIPQPFAHKRGRYGQHLAHTGTALGTFIANHDDVARFDFVGFARPRKRLPRGRTLWLFP